MDPDHVADDTAKTDEELMQKVKGELEKYFWIPKQNLRLCISGGCITLDGHFEWLFEKAAVERLVQQIDGVRGVSNRITVEVHPGQVTLH